MCLDRSPFLFYIILFYFILSHTSTFQLLDKPWSPVSSLLPPRFLPSTFLARIGFSAIPLLVDFSKSVANSRSRAFRKPICAQEKSPGEFVRPYTRGDIGLTKLIHDTRLEDSLIRHRGDRHLYGMFARDGYNPFWNRGTTGGKMYTITRNTYWHDAHLWHCLPPHDNKQNTHLKAYRHYLHLWYCFPLHATNKTRTQKHTATTSSLSGAAFQLLQKKKKKSQKK